MELRNLKTFLRVAELSSFSRAAEDLHYTQSAVTIQIKQLERELGVELFERIGKRIHLTHHGESFLPYAGEVIRSAEAALAFQKEPGTPMGPLRIGTVESLCAAVLPKVLLELNAACPQVEMTVRTSTVDGLLAMLAHNELDVVYFLDKKLDRPEWIKAAEQSVDIVFVASSRHELAGRRVGLKRIVREPFILTERGVNYRYELEQRLAAKDLVITPYLDIEHTEIIVRMLRNGESVSFLPTFAVLPHLKSGELSRIDVPDINVKMWKQLVYHKKKILTPQMRYFIDRIGEVHSRAKE